MASSHFKLYFKIFFIYSVLFVWDQSSKLVFIFQHITYLWNAIHLSTYLFMYLLYASGHIDENLLQRYLVCGTLLYSPSKLMQWKDMLMIYHISIGNISLTKTQSLASSLNHCTTTVQPSCTLNHYLLCVKNKMVEKYLLVGIWYVWFYNG